ncbi:MAG: ChaN family lipoprotein [Flavobacteriales bacterium]
MHNIKLFAFVACLIWPATSVISQDKESYRIYKGSGEQVEFGMMVSELGSNDVVLFGELHNNPIDHWLQLEFTKAVDVDHEIILGAEMFESDDQVVLDEYLAGKIKLDHLKKEAKVWPNYDTDYAPLVEYAKANNVAFIATNVPRRYASLVSKDGIDALSELSKEAKAFMPKVPYTVTEGDRGYEKMTTMMGAHGGGEGMEKLIAAQALKDYTMAHFINENLKKESVFIHFNGSFHSNDHSGIYNYLLAANKKLKIGTIAATEAETLDWNDEWKDMGDYIIVTPFSMTKTH